MKFYNFLILAFCLSNSIHAKVDPPNYDFSLSQFDIFMPGKNAKDIDQKYPTKELVFKTEQFITYKYYLKHLRYNFAVLVQFHKDVVTDFHARLPQYFLHDLFHQSLINKMGTQDIYKRSEEQAIYIWKNNNNNRHYYAGACTIICFPIFYAVKNNNQKLPEDYLPIIQQLKLSKIMIEKLDK